MLQKRQQIFETDAFNSALVLDRNEMHVFGSMIDLWCPFIVYLYLCNCISSD